jgi:hypothetical protein
MATFFVRFEFQRFGECTAGFGSALKLVGLILVLEQVEKSVFILGKDPQAIE